jgi:hypothetical protein
VSTSIFICIAPMARIETLIYPICLFPWIGEMGENMHLVWKGKIGKPVAAPSSVNLSDGKTYVIEY